MLWFQKLIVKEKLCRWYAISTYIQTHFAEVGLKEVFACFECRHAILKHVFENRGDWEGAKRLIVDPELRFFGDEDPSKEELLDAVKIVWPDADMHELIKEKPTEIFEILFEHMK